MSGTMSLADLVADLKASLQDSASVFKGDSDSDFIRHLQAAAGDFDRLLPLQEIGEVVLSPGEATYDAPAGMAYYKGDTWSNGHMPEPWDPSYPGRAPRVRVTGAGSSKKLVFEPAPSVAHIAALGDKFKFFYSKPHTIGATAADTTIDPSLRGLLILRGQAEAMRELAMRNIAKPVQLGSQGIGATTRNGTPAALYSALLDEFEKGVGCA